MKLKKVMALTLAAGMTVTSLAACGNKAAEPTTAAPAADGKTETTEAKKEEAKAAEGEKKTISVTTWDNDTSVSYTHLFNVSIRTF